MGKKKVSVVGINGIPANYGGFETLVDQLSKRIGKDFELKVYCSYRMKSKQKIYNNASLVYLPFKANGAQAVIYDLVGILLSVFSSSKVLVLGTPGCIILPLLKFYKHKIIVNYGGLDQYRNKWGRFTQRFIGFTRYLGVKYSGLVIADNAGIQNYIKNKYGSDSVLIEYGGDQAEHVDVSNNMIRKYSFLDSEYAVAVARIQKDNNVDMILSAFANYKKLTLVFIGNWDNSKYGMSLRKKYSGVRNIHMLDPVYDLHKLNMLRSNAKVYLHGHSAGGTNPSLVEAMFLNIPIVAYGSIFNKYTTEHNAVYFLEKKDLMAILENQLYKTQCDPKELRRIAESRYRWSHIINQYINVLSA